MPPDSGLPTPQQLAWVRPAALPGPSGSSSAARIEFGSVARPGTVKQELLLPATERARLPPAALPAVGAGEVRSGEGGSAVPPIRRFKISASALSSQDAFVFPGSLRKTESRRAADKDEARLIMMTRLKKGERYDKA